MIGHDKIKPVDESRWPEGKPARQASWFCAGKLIKFNLNQRKRRTAKLVHVEIERQKKITTLFGVVKLDCDKSASRIILLAMMSKTKTAGSEKFIRLQKCQKSEEDGHWKRKRWANDDYETRKIEKWTKIQIKGVKVSKRLNLNRKKEKQRIRERERLKVELCEMDDDDAKQIEIIIREEDTA